jgi:hypothetical protein
VSKARLVITAVLIEGRSQSQVARDYGVSQSWISRLIGVLLEIEALRPTVPTPDAVGRIRARRGGHRWPVGAGPSVEIPLLD